MLATAWVEGRPSTRRNTSLIPSSALSLNPSSNDPSVVLSPLCSEHILLFPPSVFPDCSQRHLQGRGIGALRRVVPGTGCARRLYIFYPFVASLSEIDVESPPLPMDSRARWITLPS